MSQIEPEFFEDLKAYVGFDEADAARLKKLSGRIEPCIPQIIKLFYRVLQRDPAARRIVRDAGSSSKRLQETLEVWLRELFEGVYDRDYALRHMKIGRIHVKHQMPQHYMCTSMNIIRNSMLDFLRRESVKQPELTMSSINKLLDLELALMLQSYKEEADQRIRESERQAMEVKLAESEHLANVGELAATLAHEIKNPLAGISGAIQIIGGSLEPGHPHKQIIGEVLSEIDRLDETVRDLLIYARPKPPRRRRHVVGALLQDAIDQLRTHPTVNGLAIHCEGLESSVEALLDESLLRQVMTNLFLNAAHACEEGGEVTCRLALLDGKIRIEVIDTGVGLAREDAARVFEAFFTTKAKGTGLGLAICKRIVESHEGVIMLNSQEGEGTSVLIEIPADS